MMARMAVQLDPDALEEAIDLVADLQHDLGKYLRMPLSFLPRDAAPGEVRDALGRALRATMRGPAGPRGARDLWGDFLAEAPAALQTTPDFATLTRVVEQALSWEAQLEGDAPLDRTAIETDLGAVGPAIRELLTTLNGA